MSTPLLYVLAAALLWSTGGLFIKWTTIGGLELSFCRSFFAIFTVAFFTRREGFGINRLTAAASFLYAVLLILFVLATKTTTAANAIFLQYTAPVYLLILEPIVYKEKFRSRDLITVAVCLGGMALFFVGQLRPQDIAGNMMALASGLCFALYFLLLRHPRAREVNRASSVIYGNTLAVIMTAPWGLAALTSITGHDLVGVAYLGVIQLGVAYTLFTLGMARGVRSLDAGIICYVEPVLNPVWVFLVLGEKPSQWALLGGSIIIVAVICHMILDARGKRNANTLPLEAAHG
jgi:drug/metabolite transporter (DMT)-like permease